MGRRSEHYCAFCSLPYRSYTQKHVGWKEVGLASGFSMMLMWAMWGRVHILGFALWLSILAWSEALLHMRWRASIKCTHCGFDPMLYKNSPERAASVVKEFLENRKNNPHFLLKPQPQLPRRQPLKEDRPPPSAEM